MKILMLLALSAAGCTLGDECDHALDRADLSDRTEAASDGADVLTSCWDADPDLDLGHGWGWGPGQL